MRARLAGRACRWRGGEVRRAPRCAPAVETGKLATAIGLEPLERSLLGEHDIGDDALAARLVPVPPAPPRPRPHPTRTTRPESRPGRPGIHGLDDPVAPAPRSRGTLRGPGATRSPEKTTRSPSEAPAGSQRIGTEHPGGEVRIVPVAQRNRRAAVYQLADLPGGADVRPRAARRPRHGMARPIESGRRRSLREGDRCSAAPRSVRT